MDHSIIFLDNDSVLKDSDLKFNTLRFKWQLLEIEIGFTKSGDLCKCEQGLNTLILR